MQIPLYELVHGVHDAAALILRDRCAETEIKAINRTCLASRKWIEAVIRSGVGEQAYFEWWLKEAHSHGVSYHLFGSDVLEQVVVRLNKPTGQLIVPCNLIRIALAFFAEYGGVGTVGYQSATKHLALLCTSELRVHQVLRAMREWFTFWDRSPWSFVGYLRDQGYVGLDCHALVSPCEDCLL